MFKTLLTATAISGLMFSSALAQSPSPPAATPAPSVTAPAPQAETAPAPKADMKADTKATGSGQFVSAQKPDQWLASKFKGTDVIGPNNEKIGDVNDLLLDKGGKVLAVIVGIGGFLGIGEKDVALDMAAFTVVPASATTSAATGTAPTGAASTSATDDPNNIKLKVAMTKDELKNAPTFERYKAPARTTGMAPASNTGTTGTTRPAAPAPAR